jgi:ketol-acid reductoisomerase
LENLKAWQTLSDDQKQALRDRDGQLRKRATEEASALIADSNLSPEQAEQFQKRYIEERRKVDTSLKQELELRRKTELEEIAQRLRKEIQSPESDKKP